MSILTVLCVALILSLGAPFAAYESLRFYTAYQECVSRQESNERLKANPICSDPYLLHWHGDIQSAACERAVSENLVGPASCAWRKQWQQGELRRVWYMVTDSHWMLFGLGSVFITSLLALAFGVCGSGVSGVSGVSRTRHAELETAHTFALIQDMMRRGTEGKHMQLQEPPRYAPRRYSYAEDDDDDRYVSLENVHRRRSIGPY